MGICARCKKRIDGIKWNEFALCEDCSRVVRPDKCVCCGKKMVGGRDDEFALCKNCAATVRSDMNIAENSRRRDEAESSWKNSGTGYGTSSTDSADSSKLGKIIIAVILVAIVGYFVFNNFIVDQNVRDDVYITTSKTDEITIDSLHDEFVACGEGVAWSIEVSFGSSNGLEKLFSGDKTAELQSWTDENGKPVLRFSFNGVDFDTGLEGEYYILSIDGKQYTVDKTAGKAYPEGSAGYTRLFQKLSPITFDSVTDNLWKKLDSNFGWVGVNKFGDYVVENPFGYNFAVLSKENYGANILDSHDENWNEYKVRGYATNPFTVDLTGIAIE